MRRGIVHIGMPRTGSTSLQVVLAHARSELARSGVLYPEVAPRSFVGPCPNHQPFGETLDGRRPKRERAECLHSLSRALAETDADTVILSYEDFAQQQRRFGVPEILRAALAQHGFAMEIAVVVKAPSEHLNSVYAHRAQMIKEKRTFSEFARGFWRSTRFDYHALVEAWLVAADGRITAVPVRDRRSTAPLIERIFSGLGLLERISDLIGESERTLIENRSPGPLAVEASRRLRRMRVNRQTNVHPREIGRFIDTMSRPIEGFETTFRGNDPEIFGRIDAHFAAANDRFAQAAWGASWDLVAQNAPWRPPNELAGRPISPETEARIAALIEQTIAQFGFRTTPAWWYASADLAEAGASRLAPFLGYRGWRVS